MRKLTLQEIEQLSIRLGVKRIAVENFLMSMGDDGVLARCNLALDAKLYKWNKATCDAIANGIHLAESKTEGEE